MRDTPAGEPSWKALGAVLERWRDDAALDDTWAANIAAVREVARADLDDDPWRGDQRLPRR